MQMKNVNLLFLSVKSIVGSRVVAPKNIYHS